MTLTRHKLITAHHGGAGCECGYDPRIVLEKEFGWGDAARKVVAHIRKSRRWRYRGVEIHYGYRYHLWENDLTGRKAAIQDEKYREMTGVAA